MPSASTPHKRSASASLVPLRGTRPRRSTQRFDFRRVLPLPVEDCPAFYCVQLDRKNHPIGRHLITLGTATSPLVASREVFRGAILAGATALVVAHNHPPGDPAPSATNIQVIRQLREAAKVIDIDHLIVGDAKAGAQKVGHHPFRAAGLL